MKDIKTVFSLEDLSELPIDIQQIFKQLSGHDYQEMLADGFHAMKTDIKDMFKSQGIDVDLSEIKMTDSHEDILSKIFQSCQSAIPNEVTPPSPKKKTKKQLDKEEMLRKAEEMQKRSISVIYKQLAKIFHPDLEMDPEQKNIKEALMKKLTFAYESKDLYTLLNLEAEWGRSLQDPKRVEN